jgi:hypothetical protein
MADDKEMIIGSVELFIDNILYDMKNVNMKTKKTDLLAHIEAWENELLTIKLFIKD